MIKNTIGKHEDLLSIVKKRKLIWYGPSSQTCPYNVYPLTTHFYKVKRVYLSKAIGIINSPKHFPHFYRRHFELIEKYHVSLKKLMQQGICNPEFYGDLVYKFKKIIGNPDFSNFFKRIVNRFKRAGYSLDIIRQTACLVFNQIMV